MMIHMIVKNEMLKRFIQIGKPIFICWDSFFLFALSLSYLFTGNFNVPGGDLSSYVLVMVIEPLTVSLIVWGIREYLLFRGYIDSQGGIGELFVYRSGKKPPKSTEQSQELYDRNGEDSTDGK